jgi:hypothetical protein
MCLNRIFVPLGLLQMLSCTTLKKARQESNVQTMELSKYKHEDSTWFGAGSGSVYCDSSQVQVFMEIVPQGIIDFHPDSGFKGQASKIRLYQRQVKAVTATDTQSARWNTNKNTNVVQQAVGQSYTRATNYKRVGSINWWLIAGCCAIAVVGWWLYRKIRTV